METKELVKALVDLAYSMRAEGLARLTYAGSGFEKEAENLIKDRIEKREAFEKALSLYVDKLVRA